MKEDKKKKTQTIGKFAEKKKDFLDKKRNLFENKFTIY